MEQAALQRGRILQLGPKLADFQTDAGLQNVNEKVFAHKWGTWMSDPKERSLGARTMLNAMSGMEGFTTAMFTQALGWSVEDVRAFIPEIKRDMRDDSLRKVIDLHVVCGQKPGKQLTHREPSTRSWSDTSLYYYLPMGLGVLMGVALTALPSLLRARRR